MQLPSILKNILPQRDVMPPKARAALEMADEVKETGREVAVQLSRFQATKDPLTAFFSHVYERNQEKNIWRNGSS